MPVALGTWKVCRSSIDVLTASCVQFVDLTDALIDHVRKSRITDGIVNIHTRHTTTALIVNENEPLLLQDMSCRLEAIAPSSADYQHDDFTIRTGNLGVDERRNGHAHCKAMLLGASETLNIVDGCIQLGRWQRVFLVELDGGQHRTVSVLVMGTEESR